MSRWLLLCLLPVPESKVGWAKMTSVEDPGPTKVNSSTQITSVDLLSQRVQKSSMTGMRSDVTAVWCAASTKRAHQQCTVVTAVWCAASTKRAHQQFTVVTAVWCAASRKRVHQQCNVTTTDCRTGKQIAGPARKFQERQANCRTGKLHNKEQKMIKSNIPLLILLKYLL